DGTIQEVEVPYEIPESWEWVRVGNICSTNVGLTFKPSEVQESGIPVYKANNIKNGKICTLDLAFVSEKTTIKDSEWLNKKDILMAVRSGSKQLVGKTAVIENLETKTSFGAFMSVIRPISVSSAFMNYFFQSSHFRSQLDEANTTTIFQVTQKMLKETLIPLPPLAEQKRIVEQIKKALAKVDEYAESYNKLQQLDKEFPDKLKKSILQYAMQGKLVAQSPDDEPVEILLEKIKAEKQKLFEAGKLKKKDLAEMVVEKGDDNSPYGKIPRNWIQTTLGQICIITTGNTPPKNDDTNYKGTTPFYKPSDLSQVTLTKASEYLSDIGLTKARKIYKGSLLVNGIGNIGLVGIDGAFNQQMHGIMPFSFVSPRFLMYAIQSDFIQNQFQNNMSSTTIPILNQTKFSQTIVRFPSIEKQDKVISSIEQLFQKVNQLF
ncbi:TPA: restriction endonuclease subunit S, partial [Streptococcus equi subsp. zooepidemicus]|nr:restriction endonuclease subunit S [Streptococcus equi subsp. zooepidemicus]